MALTIIFNQISKSISQLQEDLEKLETDQSAGLQGLTPYST